MSEENVELARRAFEAVTRGGFAAASDYVHPEIEFHTYAQSPEAGIYRGKEALISYNEHLFSQFEDVRFELDELLDAGDQVVVVHTQHAVPKGGDQEMSVHVIEVWTVRDGLLAERRSYETREAALEAAGLSE
jgi:uncharacterized protein